MTTLGHNCLQQQCKSGRSLRTCFLGLFLGVLFLDRKPCFFARARARVLCQNNPFFGSVFLPKILGGRGRGGRGGRILGCALTPRWLELDLRCCMAKRTPKEESEEGRGGIRLGRNMQQGNLAAYWLQALATLAFFPALPHANGKEIQLDSASETPSYGSCQVCLRHWRWLLSPQNKLRERSLS